MTQFISPIFVLTTYATYAWAQNSFYSHNKSYFILWVWRLSRKSVLTLTEKTPFFDKLYQDVNLELSRSKFCNCKALRSLKRYFLIQHLFIWKDTLLPFFLYCYKLGNTKITKSCCERLLWSIWEIGSFDKK